MISSLLTKLLTSLLLRKIMKKVVVLLLRELAAKSTNTIDDDIVNAIEEALDED